MSVVLSSVEKQIDGLKIGDLVCVEWFDASKARIETVRELREVGGLPGPQIDTPVSSYGVYIGVFGARNKHIILVASLWVHTTDNGQVDTTIIPLGIIEKITVLKEAVMNVKDIRLCQAAFLSGRCFHIQQRFRIYGRKFVTKVSASA